MLADKTHRRIRHAALAAAAALALACALGCIALPAWADEVGTEGEDSFDLNLAMEVADAPDPDAPVHPVTVTVSGEDGAPVAGAKVSYSFLAPNPVYYIPPDGSGVPGEYAGGSGSMALSGEAVTDAAGRARVEGIVRGCDYEVRATAAGYAPYVNTHTCKGEGSEAWAISLVKMPEEGGVPGGLPGGSGGSDAPGGGSGSGSSDPLSWLTKTGDAALPWLLALSGAALVGYALMALARRKEDGADA